MQVNNAGIGGGIVDGDKCYRKVIKVPSLPIESLKLMIVHKCSDIRWR